MAQATLTLNAIKFAKTDRESPYTVIDISSTDDLTVTRQSNGTINGYAYFGFASPSNTIKRKRLYSVHFRLAYRSGGKNDKIDYTTGISGQISEAFNPSTLMWTNMPDVANNYYYTRNVWSETAIDATIYMNESGGTAEEESKSAADFTRTLSIRWFPNYYHSPYLAYLHVFKTLTNDSTPYAEVVYDNSENVKSQVTIQSGPTGGYADPRDATQFSWSFVRDDTYYCMDENFDQSSATLYWKESTEENYTAVSASGGTKSVTIPANTFPIDSTIQWYVSGTDDAGTSSQTPVYSFSTSAPLIISTPVRPINTVEDGQSEITLQWAFSSTDGRSPTRFYLYWKEEGASLWQTLYDPGAGVIATLYNVPANTFPAGAIEWGVQALNVDGAAGAVGSATFINFASPSVSNVSADAVPFSTVTWQASDQQAYRIMVDDVLYGPYFGTEKTFELPDYLADGNHTIKVSVIGTYALWSDWAQTTVSIQNIPGEAISIDAEAVIDVSMLIYTQESNPLFLIYRDDVLIAKTDKRQFVDRFALGEHTYKVVNKLANGNYSISNEISRITCVKNANIAFLEGGEWLEIKFNPKDQSDPQYTDSVMASYNHLSGAEFPSATVSQYRDLTVTFSAVFLYTQKEELKRFESMFKKPVIIKFKDGTVFVGILGSWSKIPFRHFYTAYTFTVTQIDFEDYIDDTE